MEPVTVGAIVRSFAGLIMTENMSKRTKQFLVILISVAFFVGYQITTVSTDPAEVFASLISGLEAGLTALGMYHLTVDSKPVQ